MYYDIVGLCPRTDINIGCHGFKINFHPKWKDLVLASGLDQTKINHAVNMLGNQWLDACGYDRMFEAYEGERRRIYEARSFIRVSWGTWGPEHITVPGNACGLNIETRPLGNPLGGPCLYPHNVDCWAQVQLLLITFTWIAESMTIQSWEKIGKGEV